ncbi:MAG: Mn2+-dependent serine/threonine protein kinase [Candidatus Binatus sp.]|nr:Mn2+-dependent serine/threonine protein kinase [Candidatus Binatus sp.]
MIDRMSVMDGVSLSRGGWKFVLPGYDARFSEDLRENLLDSALAAADGVLARRVRRSRHAETWRETIGHSGGLMVYFKILDSPRGWHPLRRVFRGSRVAHVANISERLRREGIEVAEILLLGAETRGGRELIATRRVEGTLLPRFIRTSNEPREAKRAMFRALGAEIARLHRAGFLHGDLTPFNIFVTAIETPHFAFIDHERTRRTALSRLERPRLRNMVQLGRFDLQGVTNTDRMRVWSGYSAMTTWKRRRQSLRRLVGMLDARAKREGQMTQAAKPVIARHSKVGEG